MDRIGSDSTRRIPAYSDGYGAYPPGPNPGDAPGAGMDFRQILRVLRARWWALLLAIAVTMGLAWFLVPADRDFYRAAAVVRLEDARADLTAGMAGGQDTRSTEYMTSQVHVVRSEGLVGDVVDRLGLRVWPSAAIPAHLLTVVEVDAAVRDTFWLRLDRNRFLVRVGGGGEIQAQYGDTVSVDGVKFVLARYPGNDASDAYLEVLSRQAAIQRVTVGLTASARPATSLLDISYRDLDERRSIAIVNAVADAYKEFNTSGIQDRARQRREFLQGQLLRADGEFRRAQEILRQFREADRVFGSAQRLEAERANLIALDTQRRQLEDERRVYQSFLDRIVFAREDEIDVELRTLMAAPGLAASALLTEQYSQLSAYLTERRQKLASGLAPTNPEVQQITTLINATRASIADYTRNQVTSLDIRIKAIDEQRTRGEIVIRSLPETGTEEIRLMEEVENSRQELTSLRAEYQRAALEETLEVSQVQVLDYATYSTPVTEGSRTRILLVAIFFGLLLGGGGSLLVEVMNTSVRGRDELEGLLSVPALGVIPRIGARRTGYAYAPLPPRKHTADAAKLAPPVENALPGSLEPAGSSKPAITQIQEFHSMAAEAYRMLRTNLVFLTPDREMRSLLVTSAASGEGKTTTAANLAIAFARQGKRVLLVDCDLRRPRLHEMFDLERTPGFSDLLLGRASASAAIKPTEIERLYLLPRGEFDEDAAEMLSGSLGKRLIDKLQEHWDLVIFDTSPVLLTADATAIAPFTDGAVLVVRAGRTSRDAARQALQQLQGVGSAILGFVLNDPDSIGDRYGEYKYTKEYYAVEA